MKTQDAVRASEKRQLTAYLRERFGEAQGSIGFFEKKTPARRLNAVVPVNYCQFDGVRYVSAEERLLERICSLFLQALDCFCPSFLDALHREIDGEMRREGYVPGKSRGRVIRVYLPGRCFDAVADCEPLSYSKMLQTENQTSICLTESYFLTRPAFGTFAHSQLVSAAAVNAFSTATQVRDLCCETIPAFRGQGLAARNIAALIHCLQAQELTPIYRCHTDNPASLGVVHKLELRQAAMAYHCVYCRT